MIQFCHLHRHTGGSVYDGFSTPEQGVLVAKRLGQTHLAITDHGTMSMNEQHGHYCKQHGIVPIQGVEAYFMTAFEAGPEGKSRRRHLTLLAQNMTGYKNLCQLMTRANLENFYIKPIIDYAMLEQLSAGIICLSGCVLGEIPHHIIAGDMDEARRHTERFLRIFGDRFYFEVQPQHFDDQKRANDGLIALSHEFGVPAVMTNDAHFADPDDLDTYLLFRKMGKNDMDEVQLGEIRKQYENLHIADGETMCRRWEALMGTPGEEYAIASQLVAERCEPFSLEFEEEVPTYDARDANGNEISVAQALARRVRTGLEAMSKYRDEYIERVKHELKIILSKSGKADYFLLTADIVDFARKHNVPVGPGRGSGVASLVAYALGITQVDPLEFDLMFERFMHEERQTLPDFDIDFSSQKYGVVVDYLMQRLNGHIAQICNVLYYKGDNLINDLAKALNMTPDDEVLLKQMLTRLGAKEKQPSLSALLYHRKLLLLEEKYGVITHFCKMYGNPKAFGQHASGIAVTKDNIHDYLPLFVRGKESERRINTAYDMDSLSRMKIVKVDVLKLGYVDVVFNVCNAVGIKPSDIPFDDKATFDSYCNLNLKGIFQFDSPGGYNVIQEVKPRTVFEVMDAMSLDRPGALSMDQARVYVEGKAGNIDTTSLLYPFCKQTYGALLYQEQIMMVCRQLAGMTWGEASKVMKSLDALPSDHPLTIKFVEGAKKHSGIDKKRAEQLFHSLTSYTFNRGHAAAYAVLSYWGMYLKVHYPHEFFLELLRDNIGSNRVDELIGDAIANNLIVFIAHVNGSANYETFEPVPGEQALRAGLLSIPNVGGVAAKYTEIERRERGPFTSKEDFLSRVNSLSVRVCRRKVITSRVLDALEGAGALEFDFEEYKRRTIEYNSRVYARKRHYRRNK